MTTEKIFLSSRDIRYIIGLLNRKVKQLNKTLDEVDSNERSMSTEEYNHHVAAVDKVEALSDKLQQFLVNEGVIKS